VSEQLARCRARQILECLPAPEQVRAQLAAKGIVEREPALLGQPDPHRGGDVLAHAGNAESVVGPQTAGLPSASRPAAPLQSSPALGASISARAPGAPTAT
jgi:hypothetical protein